MLPSRDWGQQEQERRSGISQSVAEASTIWYSRARELHKHGGRWEEPAPPLSSTRRTAILKPLSLLLLGRWAANVTRPVEAPLMTSSLTGFTTAIS
jgi:hypothetical protein